MSAELKTGQIAKASPRCTARIAGALYSFAIVTAVLGEFVIHGKLGLALGLALGLIAVACYLAVTLLVYAIFQPVSRILSLVAVGFSCAGLALEALRWDPRGIDVAMVLHAVYCGLIGYLAFRSTFLPRILGVLMMFAGVVWLTNLSPALASSLVPYGTIAGLVGEAALMLWLLVFGLNVQRWMERATAARRLRSPRPMHA